MKGSEADEHDRPNEAGKTRVSADQFAQEATDEDGQYVEIVLPK